MKIPTIICTGYAQREHPDTNEIYYVGKFQATQLATRRSKTTNLKYSMVDTATARIYGADTETAVKLMVGKQYFGKISVEEVEKYNIPGVEGDFTTRRRVDFIGIDAEDMVVKTEENPEVAG